jgi:Zn-dependent peptidase ImmA (M78 family)
MPKPDAAALTVLDECDILEAPVPVEDVARRLGISVVHEPIQGDIDGMLYRDGTRVVIGVNSKQAEVRRRFTIAHEIGHYRLHPGHDVHVDRHVKIDFRDEVSSQATHREEIEANAFAAALLMPTHFVRRGVLEAVNKGVSNGSTLIAELARKFEVSKQAMEYRLVNLGVLTPR